MELAKAVDALVKRYDAHIVLLPLQYPVDMEACERLQHMVRKSSSTIFGSIDTEQFYP